MCLFTHFAAGALAGGVTGNVWAAAAAGLASHAVLDMIPHYDHPDWRVELAGGVLALAVLLLMPFASWAAVVGGLGGMVPDIENLLQKLGRMGRDRFVFPTHTGLLRHGRELGPRTLVWQAGIFVGCFVLLGVFSPAPAAAADEAARMAPPRVEILAQSADRTVLRCEFPVLEAPDDWQAADPRRVAYALAAPASDDGAELLAPRLHLSLAVPTRAPLQVEIADVAWWRQPAGPAADLVRTGAPAVSREVPLAAVAVALAADGGVLSGLTLVIEHPAQPRYRRQLDLAKTDDPALRADPAPAGVLNGEVFAALSRGGRAALKAASEASAKEAPAFDPFALTSNWVRLSLDTTGLHRLTGQELSAYGLSTTSVDPAKLRLYRGGGLALAADPTVTNAEQPDRVGLNEVAIEVRDGGDGEWNLDDEIRFYGVATSAWRDRLEPGAERLDHYDHPYADEAVYWLTWASDAVASPLPGSPLRAAVDAAAPSGAAPLTTARLRIHRENQFLDMAGVFADNWGWGSAITSSRVEDFELHAPVADSAAVFVVDIRGHYDSYSSYVFTAEAWLNADQADKGSVTFARTAQDDSLRLRVRGASTQVVAGANTLTLNNASPTPRNPLSLDSFDILYWGALDLDPSRGQLDFAHWGEQTSAPGEIADLSVTVPAGVTPAVWDVTDPRQPRIVTGELAGGAVTWSAVRDPATDRHYQVADSASLLQVAGGSRVSPRSLFTASPGVDYVVVHADAFASAAEDLADFRGVSLPGVTSPAARAVALTDIYNNFAGGQKDPRAVRNYLRHLYTEGAMRLRYVCLLGNASRDYRNHRGRTPYVDLYDLAPTELRTSYPTYPIPLQRPMPFASDHGLVSFDQAPPSSRDYPDFDTPDVAVGRLPALDLNEARDMVNRVISYADSPAEGPWRNHVLFTADDVVRPSTWPDPLYSELAHTAEAELLSESLMPRSIDLLKLYGVDYDFPPESRVKPAMRADINAALSAGTTIFYYVGHGAEDNLADEQVFQSRDIPNLSNGMKRPLFVAFSCDVGVFDSPTRRSMAEQFVQYAGGGAIGAICAAQVSWSSDNNQIAEAFFGNLYPDRSVPGQMTVGEALRLGMGVMGTTLSRLNSQRYNLMGDPALVLPQPSDDLAFAAASLDTIRSGARHTAELATGAKTALVGAGDTYTLQVEESARDVVFPVTTTGVTSSFVKRGGNIFRGSGLVEGAELEVPFKVPTQIRYGDRGRVRLLVGSPDGDHAAVGIVPAVRGTAGAVDDVRGPAVSMSFPDGGAQVRPGEELRATLADTSGIAILATGPGNSLLLEFDSTGFMTDVTPFFSYDPNSYTDGSVTVSLPQDLAEGRHTASLYASDTLGNVGSDTLSFNIGPVEVEGIEAISLFPNPTPGYCRLVVGVSEPMSLRWDIYSLAGSRVRSIVAPSAEVGQAVLEWHGVDDRGDEIANGTYLYVVRGRPAADDRREFTRTGKLVIMR